MSEQRFQSFEEFWPFYVREHSTKATRRLHFVGTTAAMACVGAGLLTRKRWLLAVAPVVGYGPAWIGHFFIQKNRPATFEYPTWSLLADLKMWSMIVRGVMDAEVERVRAEDEAKAAPPPSAPVENGGGPMGIPRGNGAADPETLN
jgi:hypothetical protein